MKFLSVVFFAALAVAVDTANIGVSAVEVSESANSPLVRKKRTLGVNEDVKKEVEIKSRFGGSIKISKSISYNDGGLLASLPGVMDSAANNKIRLLNQIQNGRGRPNLATAQINGASSGADVVSPGDFSADINALSSSSSSNVNVNTGASIGVDSSVNLGANFGNPISVGSESSHGDPQPIIINPATARPIFISHAPARPIFISGNPISVGSGSSHGTLHPIFIRPATARPLFIRPVVLKPVVSVEASQPRPTPSRNLLSHILNTEFALLRRGLAKKQALLNHIQSTVTGGVVPLHHVH